MPINARNRQPETLWGEHMVLHPETEMTKKPVFSASIIAQENDGVKRKLREAIEIRERRPAINRSKGWIIGH